MHGLEQLQREWRAFNYLSALGWAAGAGVIWAAWGAGAALLWLPLPAAVLVYQSGVLYRHLTDNARPGEDELLPELGWGNRLSLLRAVFIAAMMGFLLLPKPDAFDPLLWAPGVLYTLACAADFFDGYVARVTNHATRLGAVLDMSFDGLGVLAAALLAVLWGQVPAWYVLVGAARYLYLLGMALRSRLGKENYPLPPRLERRIFAGLQMGFLAVMLLPLFGPPGTHIAAALFGVPLLVGFGRDWLYTAGVLKERGAPGQWPERMKAAGLMALRMSAVVTAFWLGGLYVNGVDFVPRSAWEGWVVLHMLVLAMIGLGVMPRISAIAGLVVIGFYQTFGALLPEHIALAVIYALVMYLGGGRWSMYAAEERLFQGPVGEARVK